MKALEQAKPWFRYRGQLRTFHLVSLQESGTWLPASGPEPSKPMAVHFYGKVISTVVPREPLRDYFQDTHGYKNTWCSRPLSKMVYFITYRQPLVYFKSSLCCCSVPKLCPTLCDSMDCSPPGFPVVGFSRQEYWSRLPCPPLGDLPDPGIETASPAAPALQENSLPLSYREALIIHNMI